MAKLHREQLDRLYAETQATQDDSCAADWHAAAETDLAAIANWIASVPLTLECALFYVYEGISRCDPLPEAFFLGELDRLLDRARTSPKNRFVYEQLEAFALLDRSPPESLQTEISARLRDALGSPAPQLRRFGAYLLGDFLQAEQTEAHAQLRRLVREDPDWRVRHLAHRTLSDLHGDRNHPGAEPPPSLSVTDRLRLSVWGELRANNFAA